MTPELVRERKSNLRFINSYLRLDALLNEISIKQNYSIILNKTIRMIKSVVGRNEIGVLSIRISERTM